MVVFGAIILGFLSTILALQSWIGIVRYNAAYRELTELVKHGKSPCDKPIDVETTARILYTCKFDDWDTISEAEKAVFRYQAIALLKNHVLTKKQVDYGFNSGSENDSKTS